MTTTWKEQIQIEMEEREELGSGMTAILEGCPFTVWTTNRVYFPAQYDTSEWCSSVSRNPDGKPTGHIGGG